ncbi:hypothetical protein R50073_40920 [Maricurvus nonylphenolicus]|uniref:saccharopine dehydrogenase family protein n=1 Tax=Maricurvus nonylphenolicus TaxID=1008307 RepID=UPI0036F20874
MSSTPQVLIYGANGYTGKFAAEYLAKNNIDFIAAGRNEDKLKAAMEKVPYIDRVNVQCQAVDHSVEALTELFQGVKVVINIVGPFAQLGHEVVQACLASGSHYMDTTGEQDWVITCKEEYGPAFVDANLVLAPATSWMWNAGLIVAEYALETPGIDSIDLVYAPNGNPSLASTKSFLRMCCHEQLKLEHNELVPWPEATGFETIVPGFHQPLLALPWSGGCEPIWYKDDERVQNCSVLTAFTNRPMMEMVVGKMKEFAELAPTLSPEEKEELTNKWGEEICKEEPGREIKEVNRTVISVWARGNIVGKNLTFYANSAYLQTGVITAELTDWILKDKNKTVGFTAATHCIGHRELIAAFAEEDLHGWV